MTSRQAGMAGRASKASMADCTGRLGRIVLFGWQAEQGR